MVIITMKSLSISLFHAHDDCGMRWKGNARAAGYSVRERRERKCKRNCVATLLYTNVAHPHVSARRAAPFKIRKICGKEARDHMKHDN